MKSHVLLALCFLTLTACHRKENDSLYGKLELSGQVVSEITNKPLTGATVVFNTYIKETDALGVVKYVNSQKMEFTTDAGGNYSISYKAQGEAAFNVRAIPADYEHINSHLTMGTKVPNIQSVGTLVIPLICSPAAYARISLTNTEMMDTPAHLYVTSAPDVLTLDQQCRDTVVFVRMIGNSRLPDRISFSKGDSLFVSPEVTAAPGDTISVHFDF